MCVKTVAGVHLVAGVHTRCNDIEIVRCDICNNDIANVRCDSGNDIGIVRCDSGRDNGIVRCDNGNHIGIEKSSQLKMLTMTVIHQATVLYAIRDLGYIALQQI